MRHNLALVIVLVLVRCFALQGCYASAAPKTERDREADTQDVHEAVFRHQFKHNAPDMKKKVKSYFLSVKDKDPSPAFLKRFNGHEPPVSNGSKFREGEGVKFIISGIKWVGDDVAEVRGGFHVSPFWGSDNLYRVERKGGRWVVTSDVTKSIS